MICSVCNRDKPHQAKGMCKSCYEKQRIAKVGRKPNRSYCVCKRCGYIKIHSSMGFCKVCYNYNLKEKNPKYKESCDAAHSRWFKNKWDNDPEYREKKMASNKEWVEENREKKREINRRYNRSKKGRLRDKKKKTIRRAREKCSVVEDIHPIEIFERDDYVCQLCGKPIDPIKKYPDLMSASIDHIIPVSLGGNHTYDNLQAAHFLCNTQKSNRVDL